jgi:hypothetical protein
MFDRAQILHAREAVGIDDRPAAGRRVGRTGLGNLEENAAQRVVDLLVVLVFALGREAREYRAEADRVQEIRVSERDVQRHGELDRCAVLLDCDSLAAESLQLPGRIGRGLHTHVELAVDHAVIRRAVTRHADDQPVFAQARGEPCREDDRALSGLGLEQRVGTALIGVLKRAYHAIRDSGRC